MEIYSSKEPGIALAIQYDLSQAAISQIRSKKAYRHIHDSSPRLHEALTDSQVIAISKSRETGAALAKQYGVSEAAISQCRNGRTYKHVKR